jgi:hypothetical protein
MLAEPEGWQCVPGHSTAGIRYPPPGPPGIPDSDTPFLTAISRTVAATASRNNSGANTTTCAPQLNTQRSTSGKLPSSINDP